MATGTILYNQANKQIFPVTSADAVTQTAITDTSKSVNDCLKEIYQIIAAINDEDDTVNNIIVKIEYTLTNTTSENEVKQNSNLQWSDTFELPTDDKPYLWKHTEYTYKGQENVLNETYEIVAVSPSMGTQSETIYLTINSSNQIIEIVYEQKIDPETGKVETDDQGNPIDNINVDLDDLIEYNFEKKGYRWSKSPQSISATNPDAYMATRVSVNGEWGRFSSPNMYGRWALDSQMEIRYLISDEKPTNIQLDINKEPIGWSKTVDESLFPGKLWILTNSSVEDKIQKDTWAGPSLISIVQ